MDTTYWHKQGSSSLFEELEWDKPQRRDQAGRLLIVGGSPHALIAPAKAYEYVKNHGIGEAKIVLPEKTKRLVGATLPDAVFLPSTGSGEFSQDGTEELLNYAHWADTLLFAGDIGRNSQTTIMLNSFLRSYNADVVLTKDVLESLANHPEELLQREHTTLVISFSQLQRYIKNSSELLPLQFSMSLVQLVSYLHELTKRYPVSIVTLHEKQIICAVSGEVSTTKIMNEDPEPPLWRLQYASIASCYLTWNPHKHFAALTHSAAMLAHELLGKFEAS